MMRAIVRVEYGDLVAGIAGDDCECAFARATKRALGAWSVSVSGPNVLVMFGPNAPDRWFRLPLEAVLFVRAFDNHEHVKPATFVIEEEKTWLQEMIENTHTPSATQLGAPEERLPPHLREQFMVPTSEQRRQAQERVEWPE